MMTATSLANWSCGQGTAECGDLPGELVQYSVVSMHVTQHAARDKVYEITICRMGPLPPSAGIACACATCVCARQGARLQLQLLAFGTHQIEHAREPRRIL
jgi:hypothetical protein